MENIHQHSKDHITPFPSKQNFLFCTFFYKNNADKLNDKVM